MHVTAFLFGDRCCVARRPQKLKEKHMKIYVASSWRNERQPEVVRCLRQRGHEVYDFRHPTPGGFGFRWSEIDSGWQNWGSEEYRKALGNPKAEQGFRNDYDAMLWADTFVLLMPCGRSAHLEAGWAIGQGKPTCILLEIKEEPELMYKLADRLALTVDEVLDWIEEVEQTGRVVNN